MVHHESVFVNLNNLLEVDKQSNGNNDRKCGPSVPHSNYYVEKHKVVHNYSCCLKDHYDNPNTVAILTHLELHFVDRWS